MRKVLSAVLLTLALSFGMSEPTGAPPEVKHIALVVIDREGKEHHLKSPTCEGLSYIKVKKGEVEYSISLTNVREIEVLRISGDTAIVRIKLENGKEDVFEMPAHAFCTALSDVGNASFRIEDVKKIVFRKEER
ncbi:MAG: hypothetical protein GXO04_03080 [Aquificae bacterium]|nr:hypothetical protein [Aquificota bacterium]